MLESYSDVAHISESSLQRRYPRTIQDVYSNIDTEADLYARPYLSSSVIEVGVGWGHTLDLQGDTST